MWVALYTYACVYVDAPVMFYKNVKMEMMCTPMQADRETDRHIHTCVRVRAHTYTNNMGALVHMTNIEMPIVLQSIQK